MDLFSTAVLNRIVASLLAPPSSLLDRYFTSTSTSDKEEINFDVDTKKRRIAPFVSPLIEGKIVESRGYTTKTFKPAYVKDKRVFNAQRAFKRVMGEPLLGALTPDQRIQAVLATELEEQMEMLTRRGELMASEAIRTGKVTVVGEGYPSTVVDFGRDASLTPTALAGTARWGQSAEDPLTNLSDWSDLVLKASGAAPVDVILGADAWKAFKKNADVKARLDNRNIRGAQMEMSAQPVEGLSFKGTIDGFNIWVYGGWYVDPADNTEKVIWPVDIVAMTSALIEGERAYGAIQDHDQLVAAAQYVKSWTEPDPSVRFLLMQSAPLTVPYRVNHSLAVDVL
jgi:hypothetical protein